MLAREQIGNETELKHKTDMLGRNGTSHESVETVVREEESLS